MFTKRAITKTNIDVTVLTDYMGLWRKGGEREEKGKRGEEKEEGERREKLSEEKRDERGGGKGSGEHARNCRAVFVSFSGSQLTILVFVHCFH